MFTLGGKKFATGCHWMSLPVIGQYPVYIPQDEGLNLPVVKKREKPYNVNVRGKHDFRPKSKFRGGRQLTTGNISLNKSQISNKIKCVGIPRINQ